MWKVTFPLLLFFLATTTHVAPTNAQSVNDRAVTKALSRDAEAYAELFGVNPKEAQRRLVLQHEAGALDALLTDQARDTFGGLWIDHEPEFSVTVLSTNASVTRSLLSENLGGALRAVTAVKPAAVTLAELQAQQEEVRKVVQASGVQVDLSLDIRQGAVLIETVDPTRVAATFARQRFTPPANVEIVSVSSLAEPTDDIRGGRPVSGCTSGFAVRTPNRRLGISTAGHCPDNSTYSDSSSPLDLQAEHYSGSYDSQWHAATCDDTIRNEIFDGTANRPITGVVGRNAQSIGTFVCKYGRTTFSTCGLITRKNYCPGYVPNGKSTFILVDGNNIVDNGDSGGPWFVGNNAYGLSSGKRNGGDTAIVMAADYMAKVGYPVLTFPTVGVTPWAEIDCTATSTGFWCSAEGQSGIAPYIYSDWQYFGPAGSWSGSGTSLSGTFGFPGCSSGQFNSVLVRVTDSCGRTSFSGAEFYCPNGSGCQGPLCVDDPSLGD